MTVNNFHSTILKGRIFLLFTFFGLTYSLQAQQWGKADSIEMDNEIQAVSMDVAGNLYVADARGVITKYDRTLTQLTSSSEARFNSIRSIDANQMLKVFVFYQTTQQYQFLNRFLNPLQPPQNIEAEGFAQYDAATLSEDQMIWLVNNDRVRLQKYNPILQEMIIDTDLSYFLVGEGPTKSLQEHNNRLYLHHQWEIMMFDAMGNFMSKLPFETEKPFTLYRESLYYLEEGKLLRYHLGTMETIIVNLTPPEKIKFMLCGDDMRFFLFTSRKIIAYHKFM